MLAPGRIARAARVLARLPQPFTAAEARQVLRTTRRVAIPLLEYLDRAGVTLRLPDDRRVLTSRPAVQAAAGEPVADQVPGSAGGSSGQIQRARTAR